MVQLVSNITLQQTKVVVSFVFGWCLKSKCELLGDQVKFINGKANFPQSNANRINFVHKNKKLGKSNAPDGFPTIEK